MNCAVYKHVAGESMIEHLNSNILYITCIVCFCFKPLLALTGNSDMVYKIYIQLNYIKSNTYIP